MELKAFFAPNKWTILYFLLLLFIAYFTGLFGFVTLSFSGNFFEIVASNALITLMFVFFFGLYFIYLILLPYSYVLGLIFTLAYWYFLSCYANWARQNLKKGYF